ncbi:hypothetical protein [Roseibium album]|uniref:hypothetical protein n=1 Tax=Roseibium album TaxID=311410 RepID=UPI0039199F41
MKFKAKGIHRVRKKLASGGERFYYYVERGGPKFWTADVPVPEPPPPSFQKAYETEREKLINSQDRPHPSTLGATIAEYRQSPKYTKLKPITRRDYDRSLVVIKKEFGKKRISAFTKPQNRKRIKAWHWQFETTPRQGDMHLGMLVTVLNFAIDQGDIASHCATNIDRMHEADHSSVIWLPDENEALVKAASRPGHFLIQTASFTGLRRSDVVTIPATADKGDHLNWWTSKSNKRTEVVIPIIPEYRAVLDEMKTYRETFEVQPMTLHCNSKGLPYSPWGLDSVFDRAREQLSVDKRFHDLRGTAVHNFIRANFTDDEIAEIAEIVGWKTEDVKAIRRKYADRATIVKAAIDRLSKTKR